MTPLAVVDSGCLPRQREHVGDVAALFKLLHKNTAGSLPVHTLATDAKAASLFKSLRWRSRDKDETA